MIDPKKLARRAEMKRRGCRDCLFFDPHHRNCAFGMRSCILNGPEIEEYPTRNAKKGYYGCSACPYGKGRPCVSFCMKQLLEDWRSERSGAGKEVCVHA